MELLAKREHLAFSITIGLLLGWLVLLETGLAHRWGWAVVLLDLAILLVCCAAAHVWLAVLTGKIRIYKDDLYGWYWLSANGYDWPLNPRAWLGFARLWIEWLRRWMTR